MKNKFLTILLLLCTLLICGCGKKEKPNYTIKSYSYYGYLDTVSSITVQFDKNKISENDMMNKMKYVETILLNIEQTFSAEQTLHMQLKGISKSMLMEVNENSGKKDEEGNLIYTNVNDEFMELTKKSIELSSKLEGSFDVTIGPLSSLWDISGQVGEPNPVIPTDEAIKEKLSLVNYSNILLDETNKRIALKEEKMKIDFGAIAKGYAADVVLEYMKTLDIKVALINLGGNIYSYGESDDQPITISIRNPFWSETGTDPYTVVTAEITNISAVTSGTYERYITVDNKVYHHLLDPKTGYPFDNEISSVTIFGESSTMCDGLATGIYGLGLEKGIEKIKEMEEYKAVFITKDKKIYIVGDIKFTLDSGTDGFEIINK